MKHFIEVSDFSKEELISLIEVGQDIIQEAQQNMGMP